MSQDKVWRWNPEACRAAAVVELTEADRPLFRDFVAEAEPALRWIASLAGAPSFDPDALDLAYRKLHVILGFSRLWEIAKLAEILTPAEIAFDHGRRSGNFEQGSIDYVIRLATGVALAILDDLGKKGFCDLDITETVEECARYIHAYEAAHPAESPIPESGALFEAEPSPMPVVPASEGLRADDVSVDLIEDLAPETKHSPLTEEFCVEARDNIVRAQSRLLDLENAPGDREVVNELFRCIHTVKGGARLLAVRKMETLAHEMESLLGDLRSGRREAGAETIDVLIASNRALAEMVEEIARRAPISTTISGLLDALRRLQDQSGPSVVEETGVSDAPAGFAAVRAPVVAHDETLRVPTGKLDDVLNTASEVFVTRMRLQAGVAGLAQAIRDTQQLLRSRTGAGGRQNPAPQIEDVADGFDQIELGLEKVDLLRRQLQKDVSIMETLSGRLQSGAMNFRMVPVSHLFGRFPVLVRDMARSLGKRVRLEIEGNSTELDRVLIRQLFDPLLHILRNAIDHGLETPQQRRAAGKSEAGCIRLTARYEGSYVLLEVSDDGRGLMVDSILKRAVDIGLTTPERAAQMSRNELVSLIFEPGFSTREDVSTLSGRGVGMDVVRTVVQQMQGMVTLETTPGKGTVVRIKAPLTLAIVGVVLIEERGFQFAIPVLNICEILLPARTEIRDVAGVATLNFRGRTLPLASLSAVMGFPASAFIEDRLPVVVVQDGDKELGLVVDRLLGRHDVLIRQFGSLLKRLPCLMGCTILSNNRLVGVVDVIEVIRRGETSRVESGKTRREALDRDLTGGDADAALEEGSAT